MMTIQPMQWAALPELQDAPPLDDADLACLAELRGVLARHGKLRRFAVHLAHRHFELGEGEALIERPDPDGRTQHVTVGRLDDEPDARPTTWLFDDSPALHMTNAVYCVCVGTAQSLGACIKHGKSQSPGEAAVKEDQAKQERIHQERGQHEAGFPVAGHDRTRRRSIRDGDI